MRIELLNVTVRARALVRASLWAAAASHHTETMICVPRALAVLRWNYFGTAPPGRSAWQQALSDAIPSGKWVMGMVRLLSRTPSHVRTGPRLTGVRR